MSDEFIFKFNFKGNIKKVSFYTFDTFHDLSEWTYENYNLTKDQKIVYNIPPEFGTREKPKIKAFFDSETFKYFNELIINIKNKDLHFFKNTYTIIIEPVPNFPEGIPTLQKEIGKSVKRNQNQIKEKLKVQVTSQKLEIESYKYNIDKLNNKEYLKFCHNNITCNNCFKQNFVGLRFICSECNKFNLCENCESMRVMNKIEHDPNHLFIQIKNPINIDNYKFNNLIQKKRQVINIYETPNEGKFKVNFIIHNIGENSFKNCFLYPICYGENYVYGNIVKIENDVFRGENISIDIEFDNIKEQGTYYSKWRMFNQFGIPFGEIIYLTFIILEYKKKN
jgi:hypothetical protein